MATIATLSAGGLSVDLTDTSKYAIVPLTWDASMPGQLRFRLLVHGTTADARVANALAVQNVLNRAGLAADMGQQALLTRARGTTQFASYVVTGGTLTPATQYPSGAEQVYDVALTTLPYLIGDATTVTVAGALSGTTAAIFVPSVGGDTDALVHLELTDTSAAGVINRVHLARVSALTLAAATDFTPWVNAAALSGATAPSDATAVGGTYASRALTGLAAADVGRAVMPAGSIHRGRRDVWGRVSGSGTALSAPTSFSGSKVDATQTVNGGTTETIFTPSPGLTIGSSASVRNNSNSLSFNITVALSATTLGSTLVMSWLLSGTNASAAGFTPPTGFTVISDSLATLGTTKRLISGVRVNSASVTNVIAALTQGSAATLTYTAIGTEIKGVPTASSLHDVLTGLNSATPTVQTSLNGEMAVYHAHDSLAATNTWSFPFDGYTSLISTTGLAAGYKVLSPAGAATTHALSSVFGTDAYVAAFTLLPSGSSVTTTTGATTTFDTPTPGALAVGAYVARVQAIDAVGYRSNATASATVTTVISNSSATWTWVASTNAVAYALTIQFGSLFYEVITTNVSYTLTTLAGLGQVAGLPATSGALAPAPFVKARVRTLNDYTASELDEVATNGLGTFALVRLGADRPLPPIGWDINLDWVDWAVEVQGRSANGAAATVNVDALWTVPSREPQGVVWVHGLALAAKRRWVVETGQSGRDIIAWLEDTSTGAEAGRLLTSGAPLLAPGNNILLLAFEQAAGVSVMAASVTVTLRYYTRFLWERGAI